MPRDTKAHLYRSALEVILKTMRDDEYGECITIRKWLDQRGVYNGDIGGRRRLVELVCTHVLTGEGSK